MNQSDLNKFEMCKNSHTKIVPPSRTHHLSKRGFSHQLLERRLQLSNFFCHDCRLPATSVLPWHMFHTNHRQCSTLKRVITSKTEVRSWKLKMLVSSPSSQFGIHFEIFSHVMINTHVFPSQKRFENILK